MSTQLITIEEAATHLGVSDRTVRTYIAQNLLSTRTRPGSRRKWLNPLEVEELRTDLIDGNDKRITSKDLAKLRGRVRRLEAELDVVLRMLDARAEPLGITVVHAEAFYSACVAELKRTGWELPEIENWVDVFMRISEDDFKVMLDHTGDARPWVPFLRLCISMTAFLSTNSEYTTNVEMQSLHRQLAEARRRLRISAMCCADLYSVSLDSEIRRSILADSPRSVQDSLSQVVRNRGVATS